MRLFIAIDPPEEVRAEVAALCRGIEGARWVPSEQFHVTLRFLGEVGPEMAARIGKSLESVREPAFRVGFAGVGRFPPRRSPRVLWAGLEPEEPPLRLHDEIESRLREIGVAGNGKKFSPHLTLARLREGANTAQTLRWLERWNGFRVGPFLVSLFFLYSSILGPGGAQHRRESSYDLKGLEG
jgi:2'-5' RNA ligase